MIKAILLLVGEEGAEAFSSVGASAATAVREAFAGVAGYIQTRAIEAQPGDAAPAYRGFAELWFPPAAGAWRELGDGESLRPLLAEGVSIAGLVLGLERTVMRLPEHAHGVGIKGVFPFHRKPGMGVEDFQAHWWHRHGPIAARTDDALAYYQCHPLQLPEAPVQSAFDGVTEIYWRNAEDAIAAMGSRQMVEDQATDARNFVDTDSVQLVLAEEEVVIAP